VRSETNMAIRLTPALGPRLRPHRSDVPPTWESRACGDHSAEARFHGPHKRDAANKRTHAQICDRREVEVSERTSSATTRPAAEDLVVASARSEGQSPELGGWLRTTVVTRKSSCCPESDIHRPEAVQADPGSRRARGR